MTTFNPALADWNLQLRPRRQGQSAPRELVIQSSDPDLLEKTRTLLELFHERLAEADQTQLDELV